MPVEKGTDMFVFNMLMNNGYINGGFESINPKVHAWAEVSDMPMINSLFETASKRKSGRAGRPEFIIFDEEERIVIVIEDKRDTKKHIYEADIEQKVDEYSVNGALWYASHVKNEFDVVAIAVSGTDYSTLKIDTFGWKKNIDTFTNFNLHEIHPIEVYRDLMKDTEITTPQENQIQLLESAREINEFMHNEMNIIEHNRLYILGSILFALEDPVFKTAYSQYNNNNDIGNVLWNTLERKILGSAIENKQILISELRPTILALCGDEKKGIRGKYPKGSLHKLISEVDKILYQHYKDSELDLISLFFNIFLSYSTKGGSDLGIVLTPSHVTRLFNDLANSNNESKILDPCAGTGGFLMSAWRRIALSDEYTYGQKEEFRRNNLYGVEIEPSVYTLVALNMFLNRDGQSHLIYGDCFSLKDVLTSKNCNVGYINPPYSNDTYSEISFVELMLDCLLPNSIGVAIVPVNATSSRTKRHKDNDVYKQRILQKHKLIASIEMPKNLFYPKGTETIVLVFQTGQSNEDNLTWLAKFDDGYDLRKHQKTRTVTERSEVLYNELINDFRNKNLTDHSLLKQLTYEDQWVYTLFTDEEYDITQGDLQKTTNEFIAYLLENQYL